MMLRRLLVAMDGSGDAEAGADRAIAWARRFGFAMVGLGVLDEPTIEGPEAVPLGAGYYKRERDAVRLAAADERIRWFLRKFRERCGAAGVPCTIVEDVGVPHEQIVREAVACDAVLLGIQTNFHFATPGVQDQTLSHVLRLSPRPVIVVPRHPMVGEGVLVAYGGGQQVARALQTFTLLGLAADEPVVVIAIDRDGDAASQRLLKAGEYLDAHEIPHELIPMVSEEPPAQLILDEAERRRPRMIVMGAPGHHPVRDLFSTSVTRAVLAATPAPVFVGS
jgi:nucleotide-binding universal stress UspA family protein